MAYSGKVSLWSVDYEWVKNTESGELEWSRHWFTTKARAEASIRSLAKHHRGVKLRTWEFSLSRAGVQNLLNEVALTELGEAS